MRLFFFAAMLHSFAPMQTSVPNRQPELAATRDITALVFSSGGSIWFAASRDRGATFSKPTEVAKVPVLAVGRHRGPHVVISGKTIVVSAIYGNAPAEGEHAHGLPANGDLAAWRSEDGGATWSQPTVINDVPGSAREGLHAMAAGENGELASVWLDLRSKGTRLYGSFSKDNGVSWSKNILIFEAPGGTICQCCHPSIVFSGKHEFNVMFRNVLDNSRDLFLARWDPRATPSRPVKIGLGSWNINGCPMDGGGLVRRGNKIITAWRRDETVYLDEAGQPETPVGQGKDVALAVTGRGSYVAWTSKDGIEVHRSNAEMKNILIGPGGAFVSLTALPDDSVLAAWEHDGRIEIETVR
jgi:hypothetical protein